MFDPKQRGLCDGEEGQHQGLDGMALAANHAESLLEQAQEIALELAADGREISADDVQRVLHARTGKLLGNACGSLFRGPEWVFTGKWRASPRITNHARMNSVDRKSVV